MAALALSLFCALTVGGCAKGTTSGTPPGGCDQDTCGTQCVDLQSDPRHCGDCNTSCGAGQQCNGGSCTCVAPLTLCGSTCVNVNSDPAHCGGCTRPACATGQVCNAGQCASGCTAPLMACPGGQCVDVQNNPLSCGTCGHACPSATPACNAGVCGCPPGQTLCSNGSCMATCPSTGGTGGRTGGTGGTPGVGVGGMTGTGVGGSPGTAGTGAGTRACPPSTTPPTGMASIDVISDFEEGAPPTGPGAVLVKQGTPQRTGWWYVYADPTAGTQTPPSSTGPVNGIEASGSTDTCNKFAFHTTAGNHPMYVGFGATFLPAAPPSTSKSPIPVDAFDGISFKMKAGGGTNPPIFVQVLTRETQPVANGGTIAPTSGTTFSPAHIGTDLYNSRGMLINKQSGGATWQPLLNTTAQTYYIPFAMLYPQWVPAPGGANGGCALAAAAGDPKCQAPTWNAASALSLQISVLSDFAMTSGQYNVVVDDVMFYKRAATGTPVDLPAPPTTAGAMHPFPQNGSVGANCRKPVGPAVDGKFLTWAYRQWRDTFVVTAGSGLRVQRPEVNNDTVSEGIAYGMLIGVYMNDKALFDGLWTYWKANQSTADGPLMTWITGGSGTATDADEDAAFAMLMASRQWGGSPAGDANTYQANALNLMHAVLAHDMQGTYIKGGSNYSNQQVTNPSYFSPAWYRVFAAADTANAAAWNGLATGAYTLLGNLAGSSAQGLYAAWCTAGSCTAPAQNTGSQNPAQDVDYQYDSHRIPFRIGLDYCWNGTAAATAHLGKNAAFFSGKAGTGVGRVLDIYTPGGGDVTGSAPNSASILGTSAVGAMHSATYQTYLNDAYQAVFDMATKATLAPRDTMNRTPYSYYNATVGLLTLLAMTGNLTVF